MNNFDIYNLVNYVLNIDVNGNAFSPPEFEDSLNSESLRLFKKKLGLPEEYQPNAPIPRQGADVSSVNQKDLRPFLRTEPLTITAGEVDVSAKNIAHVLGLAPNPQTGHPCDDLSSSEFYDRINNPITIPTLYSPVSVWQSEDVIQLFPSTITSANIKYYTYPIEAVFVVTADPTTLLPVYDAGSSTELEWDDINKVDLAQMVLRSAGVNMQRNDIQNYANNIIKTGD